MIYIIVTRTRFVSVMINQMRTANFRGDMVGICTYNNQNDKGYIDIDYFEYHVKNRIDAL